MIFKVVLRFLVVAHLISLSTVMLLLTLVTLPEQVLPCCLPSPFLIFKDFPGGSDGKASVYNAGDLDSSPGLGRSPGEGNGSPLQCCCLEDPMDRGGWYATVCGVAKSRTRLSNFTSLHFNPLPGDWSPVPEFQAEIRSSDPLTGHL